MSKQTDAEQEAQMDNETAEAQAADGAMPAATAENGQVAGYRHNNDDVDPPYLFPDYQSTQTRAPKRPLIPIAHTLTEVTGPAYGHEPVGELDHDLTRQYEGEPVGERIIVHGRLLDGEKRPVRNSLVEIWQANAGGRYRHEVDTHPAAMDPNFAGAGRCMTDDDGYYKFISVLPGSYPWQNHPNAWRARHIHFSVFGTAFATRLITQMYFPGEFLFFQDPIYHSVRDQKDRDRMMSSFDYEATVPEWALAFKFDIVLRGRDATPMEEH